MRLVAEGNDLVAVSLGCTLATDVGNKEAMLLAGVRVRFDVGRGPEEY